MRATPFSSDDVSETPPEAARFCLRDLSGSGSTLSLGPGEHRLGRESHADIQLGREGVSRRHATLRVSADQVTVVDLGSKNGTRVNGHRIDRAELHPGDRIRFGSVELVLEEREAVERQLAFHLSSAGGASDDPSESVESEHSPDSVSDSTLTFDPLVTAAPTAAEHPGGALASWSHARGFLARLASDPNRHREAASALASALGLEALALFELGPQGLVSLTGAGSIPPEVEGQIRAPGYAGDRKEYCLQPAGDRWRALVSAEWGTPRRGVVGIGDGISERCPKDLLRFLLSVAALRWPAAGARNDPRTVRSEAAELRLPEGFVSGTSEAMARVLRQLRPVAGSDLPVLITGETGTGKELFAQIVHGSSERRGGPLVPINCAAIPGELLEAELFGIEARVATGVAARPGKFRQADGGTLFLDEIGEMPAELQAKLLRALEQGFIEPVGGRPMQVDVRVVAATHVDVDALESSGRLRQDLYFRLAGCAVELPALRERGDDVLLLTEHFARRFALETGKEIRGFTVGAMRAMTAYSWPGNVRELRNEVARLVRTCADGEPVRSELLSRRIHRQLEIEQSSRNAEAAARAGSDSESTGEVRVSPKVHERVATGKSSARRSGSGWWSGHTLEEIEKAAVIRSLERSHGRVAAAAAILGITRHGMKRRIRKYGLDHLKALG